MNNIKDSDSDNTKLDREFFLEYDVKKMNELNLRNQLRHYISQRGITASRLAQKCGIPKQSLHGWLSGSNPRDVRQIKRVAEFLQVSIDHLLFGSGDEVMPKSSLQDLASIVGDNWVGGIFEVRMRSVNKNR